MGSTEHEGGAPSHQGEAAEPSQPTDPSVPTAWQAGATSEDVPAGEVRTVEHDGETCRQWDVVRTLRGPIREGRCKPVGAPVLIAWYRGKCQWDIYRIQRGIATRYQLTAIVAVRITVCGDRKTEQIVARAQPFWAALGPTPATCSQTVLNNQPITGRPPLFDDCPDNWDPVVHGGIPHSVRDALDEALTKEKAKDAGATALPYPFAPPPPPQPTGPTIGPMPSPEEMARRYREEAERRALNPLDPQGERDDEHPHEETPEEKEMNELMRRMRQADELERELERMRREAEDRMP